MVFKGETLDACAAKLQSLETELKVQLEKSDLDVNDLDVNR